IRQLRPITVPPGLKRTAPNTATMRRCHADTSRPPPLSRLPPDNGDRQAKLPEPPGSRDTAFDYSERMRLTPAAPTEPLAGRAAEAFSAGEAPAAAEGSRLRPGTGLRLKLLKVRPEPRLRGQVVVEAAATRGGLACRTDIVADLGDRRRVAGPADGVYRQSRVLAREQHVVAGVPIRTVLLVASRAPGRRSG